MHARHERSVDTVGSPVYTECHRRGGRADEGGGLENRCALIRHRGFESLPLRQTVKAPSRPGKPAFAMARVLILVYR